MFVNLFAKGLENQMVEELVDIFDENQNVVGVETKKDAHKKGLWHQASHVWIYNSKGEILLQLRAKNKDSYPGLWDISAAGHISAGESPEVAAVRELFEEIGIKIKPKDLKKIFVRKVSQIVRPDFINKEFDHVFLWKYDGDKSKLKLQKEEVDKLESIPIKRFESELKDPKLKKAYVPHGKYYDDVIAAIRKELGE